MVTDFFKISFYLFYSVQLPSRAAAGDEACDSTNGMWRSNGAHLHVYGPGGHRVQPLWWSTGKDKTL